MGVSHGSGYVAKLATVCSLATAVAIVLSLIWRVPYIMTFVGFAALGLIGHIVTIDDDMPGGWSNPDGSQPFPWKELLIKAAVLVGLGLAALFPSVRALGQ